MTCVLTLDGAPARCTAGLVERGAVLAEAAADLAALPALVDDLLRRGAPIGLVAVTIGPGGFTGLRAAIALAHGVGLGAGVDVVGVTLGAALVALAPPGRPVWVVTAGRRGLLALERNGHVALFAPDALPVPEVEVALAGDAAPAAAALFAGRGPPATLLDLSAPTPLGIARAALSGAGRPAAPLYLEPPAVTVGKPGRPAPA